MQHVFVSYKHEDLDFAENVINRVEKAGFSTWTDDKLHAGEDWRAMIDIAIRNAFALIVIMTPEVKASEYVTYEWAFAWGVGVRVIPLMLKPTPLHPRLEAMQYLDFTNPKSRPWDRLIEEIKAAANVPLAHTINIPLSSPPYVRQAVIALDSAVESDRVGAVRTLQQVRNPEAQTVLIEALQHPVGDVRWSSAEALGQMGVISAVPELIKLVHDPEVEVRMKAAEALGRLGDTSAIPALAARLRSIEAERLHFPEIGNRENIEVAIALGRLGDTAAASKLAEILGDRDVVLDDEVEDAEWKEIGRIVGGLGDTALIPVLRRFQERRKPNVIDIDFFEQDEAIDRAIEILQRRFDGEEQLDVSNT